MLNCIVEENFKLLADPIEWILRFRHGVFKSKMYQGLTKRF